MQREVIKWLQALDLSYPVRNPRRDFSNGFIAAEIVCRYFDDRYLSMRGISQSTSPEARRHNWEQVHTALLKLGCRTITYASVENVICMNPNAALNVLEHMYEFFTKKLLPMRSIDGVAPTQYLKSKDASVLTALLQSVREVDSIQLPMLKDHSTDPQEQQNQHSAAVTLVQNTMAVGRNAEIVGGLRPLLRPRYAHQTASSLIHQANQNRYSTRLHQPKNEPDVLESRKRNEHIIEQHQKIRGLLNEIKDRKEAEVGCIPTSLTARLRGRYYASPKDSNTQKRRHGLRGRTVQKSSVDGLFQEPGLGNNFSTGGSGRRIEVNVLSNSLMHALENNGIYLNRDARAGEKSIEFFTACDYSIRKAFSSILKDVLAARKELLHIFERSVKSSESDMLADLFTAFVAQRDDIPTETLEACWTALEQNTSGIAVAICSRPEEYGYILQTLHYLFTLEASQMHVLHVSGSKDADGAAAVSTTAPPFSLSPNPSGRQRSQSISHALLGGWGLEGDGCPANALDSAWGEQSAPPSVVSRRPRAQWSDRQAFHYASAFVLLSKIAESLQECNPVVAEMVLEKYFLPAALPFLIQFGRPGMVEAVGRVIVAFLMGPTITSKQLRQQDVKDNYEWDEEHRALTHQRLRNMATFLECILQPMVAHEELLTPTAGATGGVGGTFSACVSAPCPSDRPPRFNQRLYLQQRYYFLVYNVMRQTLAAYTWTNNVLRTLAGESEPSQLRSSPHEDSYPEVHPLESFASDVAVRCLSSEHSVTRATGIAITTMLLFWDAWIPFISIVRHFILCHPPSVGGEVSPSSSSLIFTNFGSSGQLLFSSHSYDFEGRVLTLGLLCLLFKKIVLLVCEDSGTVGDEGSNSSSEDSKRELEAVQNRSKGEHHQRKKADNRNSSSMSSTLDGGFQGSIVREQKEYRAACKKVMTALPFSELDRIATKYLRSFAHAPLKQRQLALGIVGQHLLPDGHPRLASVWLRLVCALPSPHADTVMTLPFSFSKLEMRRPSAFQSIGNATPSGTTEAVALGSEGALRSTSMISPSLPHENIFFSSLSRPTSATSRKNSKFCRGILSGDVNGGLVLSDSPDASPIGLLFGQVSPSYSLVPLNQVWDTYSVVHAVLRHLDFLDPIKTLEIIAAALLSPQEQDSQLSQLLRNFQFSTEKEMLVGERVESSSHQPRDSGSHSIPLFGEEDFDLDEIESDPREKDMENMGALTLRDLVFSSSRAEPNPFSYTQINSTMLTNTGENIPHQVLHSSHYPSDEEEEEENGSRWIEGKEAAIGSCAAGRPVATTSNMQKSEHHFCRAFWYTALQRLEPVISSQLPSLSEGEKTFDELSHGEQLAFAVLKTLYYRYVMEVYNWVETSPSILVESIREAAYWLQAQKSMWYA